MPEGYARSHVLVPFDVDGDPLSVAMADPRDRRVIAELQRITKLRVTPCLAAHENILRAQLLYRGNLFELLRQAAEEQGGATPVTARWGESAAPTLPNRILEYAAVSEASDIHIEPYEHETLVRYRIDGMLREVLSIPPATIMGLAVRVKPLSGMRVDDRRSPQDGRFDGDLEPCLGKGWLKKP